MTTIKLAVIGLLVAAVVAEPPVYHQNEISSSYGVPQADYSGYSGGSYSGGGYSGGGYSGGGYSGGYDSGFGGGNGGGYGGGHEDYSHHQEEHHEAKPYEFGYAVKDHHHGTDFGQQESSDGHNVKGSYRVLLPDGRVQIVTYHADWKTGFHADVKYEGEAHYPEPQQHGNQGGYHYPAPGHADFSGAEHSGQGYNHGGYKR